jgi:hypothetical protein
MAERALNTVAKYAPIAAALEAWQNIGLSKRMPKAHGFGAVIERLEPVDSTHAFLIYAGHFIKFGSDYTDLNWLRYFAASNRQLHSLYARKLLQEWRASRLADCNWCQAVQNLAIDGPKVFTKHDDAFLESISFAFQKLLNSPTRTSLVAIEKAIAIFHFDIAFKGFEAQRKIAAELFSAHIENVIFADGGPVSGDPQDVTNLLTKILPLKVASKPLPQCIYAALDRMMGFVALLQNCNPTLKALIDPQLVRPHLAPLSGFACLAQGKSVLNFNVNDHFSTDFYSDDMLIFNCKTSSNNLNKLIEYQAMPQGELLQTRQHRLFLSLDGKDLRCENQSAETTFTINPDIKVSALRDGGIMFVTPKQQYWHLTLRGAEAHLEKNGEILKIFCLGEKMNWAFKKHEKSPKSSRHKRQVTPDLLS